MMDISIHTEVRCLDGLVGKSTHIIVDLVTEQVTHIVLKAKDLGDLPTEHIGPYVAGAFAAFVTGLVAIYTVLASIRKGKFQWFAYYCIVLGIVGIVGFSLWG